MSIAAGPAEHTYHYLFPSSVNSGNDKVTLALATSGGCAPNPWLASGFVEHSAAAARALVSVGNVAAERFWTPPNMVAAAIAASDPVVTTDSDVLRFESFSQCGGVYARFDLDSDCFDGEITRHGTTNVDMGSDLRRALSQVGGRDPLKLSIGADSVQASTLVGTVIERQIPLPERWVRGFANVALATSQLEPRLTITGAAFRRFVQTVPRSATRQPMWATSSGSALRLSSRPRTGSVGVSGVDRLSAFRTVLPHIESLVAYSTIDASTEAVASGWVAHIPGGRLTITLSPESSRGFSGEGAWLFQQTDELESPGRHVAQATAGRRGFDAHHRIWFERDLPYDLAALEAGGKRLQGARKLLAAGAVSIEGDSRATVASGQATYSVNLKTQTCTCPWWGKHQGSRGPCKHVLAATIQAKS